MTIITLIHGTWARGADWTKETSPLAIALKDRLPGEVRIERFPWSGRNLHFMRRRAAKDLQKHILALGKEDPTAKQFLIAHSHGGNVAMYALSDPDVKPFVTGTVCLSTPFIQCRARPLPTNALILLGSVVVVVSYFLLHPSSTDWLIALILLLITTWVIGTAGKRLLSKVVLGHQNGTPADVYQAIIRSFGLPSLTAEQLFILRAPGDEASATLGASVFASWVFGKLSQSAGVIHRLGSKLQEFNNKLTLRRRILGTFCALLIGVLALFLLELGEMYFPLVLVIVSISLLGLGGFVFKFFGRWGELIQIAYMILLVPLLLVCSFFSVAFGVDAALVASFIQLSVEVTPVGRFSVVSLSAPTARGLWHSLPYSDAEAFDAIVAWIKQRLAEGIGR